MSYPLLLDEMFADRMAVALVRQGHDVVSVVTDPHLMAIPDDQVLAESTRRGRALVTFNVKDFLPLDAQYRARGQSHGGLVLVSSRTFPQDLSLTGSLVGSLGKLLADTSGIGPDQIVFLRR
jgi:hypothetical protein